jgi:subtilisin family serine protease
MCKMKRLLITIMLLSLIGSVVAIDLSRGNSEANSILPEETSTNSVDLNLLDSPKIQSILKQEAEALGAGEIPVIVQFNSKLTSDQKSDLVNLANFIKYEYSIINAAALSIDISELNDLASLSFAKAVEYDADTSIVLAQSTTQIGASRVWLSHGVEGEGVTVAVLDTGIDNEHPDLKNVVEEQDFTGEGTDDQQGHGTHVASTVAGSGAASGGVNKGIAPKAELFDVKVLGRTGSGKLSDTIAGIEWSVLNGADIISMSLGAQIPCNGLDATSLASDAAVKRGVHVVVAAGNTGPAPATIGSPGCAREVITVGAVDRLDNMALFSSRGPTLDGRTKPEIVAPGVLILAAKNGGGYAALSGTSMATPHVSGVVALLLSQKQGLSPEQIKDVLMKTTKDLGEGANTQGAGRVEAYDAFIEATGLEPQEPPKEEEKKDESSDSGSSGKKKAEKKSKDEGYVDDVKGVDEKKSDGKRYYVVEGSKSEAPSKIVRVWVNQETGNIERVEEMSYLGRLWLYVVEFFQSTLQLFS